MTPNVSVCVSTFNRAASLDRLLTSLAAQDISGFEVVVYDDASSDETPAVLASWGNRLDLKVLRAQSNAGPACGRNVAWRAASASLVLFTDDDCVPCPSWVREHLAAHTPAGITVGQTLPDPSDAHLDGPFSRTLTVQDATAFQTCNIGYPRWVLEQVGGFDERYRRAAGEDTDLGLRALAAGASASYVEQALVHHAVRPSSWWAALRETQKWVDVPLFAATHSSDGSTVLYSHRWWRRSHPLAIAASLGLLAAKRHPVTLVAVVPWVRFRAVDLPGRARRRHWPLVLAGKLVVDLAEVAVLARGSVRHRRLML
ncbi:MAG: glycosyl transferase family 2 [Frankiales bacterium]|nr:glycosyl transferase family 2 [Frankiales bacterium]